MTKRIAAIITSYNRRALTLQALSSLLSQKAVEEVDLTVFLVDDGSTDGTGAAVAEQFPFVRLIQGDGSLFWNGGMRLAFEHAMREEFDAFLWFNDDARLYPDALSRLLLAFDEASTSGAPALVTGTMRHPVTGKTTYGGKKIAIRGIKWDLFHVEPDPVRSLECDSMNGNLVLIPAAVAKRIGNLDPVFRHQTGDLDYGLRARKAGFRILIAPGYHGECTDNSRTGTWRDGKANFQQRLKHLNSPKGIPVQEWWVYTRRHYSWRWPIYFFSPLIKALLGIPAAGTQH